MGPEEFSRFLTDERKRADLTQSELAKKLNVSTSAVSKWERGLSMPEVTRFEDIARVFDLSVMELLECRRLNKKTVKQDEKVIYKTIEYSYEEGRKKAYKFLLVAAICLTGIICCIAGYYHALSSPAIDYGESEIYSLEDRMIVTKMIREKMSLWEGTRLIKIRYSGDDISQKESDYLDSMIFETEFRSVVNGGNHMPFMKRTWTWEVSKTDGEWKIVNFGEG